MGYYTVPNPKGQLKFRKDEQGLPYIDLEGLGQEAEIMLLQGVWGEHQTNVAGGIKTAPVNTV
jgi:hypothetical protein